MNALAVAVVVIAGIVAIAMRIAAITVLNFYVFATWDWPCCGLMWLECGQNAVWCDCVAVILRLFAVIWSNTAIAV